MNKDCTFAYKTLFGPVPSRRLGLSLGVDLVRHKTCNLDCVYCECGPTTHLTMKRKEYVAVDRVTDELKAYLSRGEKLDHITFSGSGEPTLNDGIGEVIRFLKHDYPQYKVALLTNSTLLGQRAVRSQVQEADVVMASLDAGSEPNFKRVNRPHPAIAFQEILDGLVEFRKTYSGRLYMEYFAVDDCNSSMAELGAIRTIIRRIDADGVLINTLDRPGTQAWVKPIGADRMKIISDFLKGAEIVKYKSAAGKAQAPHRDLMARLVSTIRRRPCTAIDVARVVGVEVDTVQALLDQLVVSKHLAVTEGQRGPFYVAI